MDGDCGGSIPSIQMKQSLKLESRLLNFCIFKSNQDENGQRKTNMRGNTSSGELYYLFHVRNCASCTCNGLFGSGGDVSLNWTSTFFSIILSLVKECFSFFKL